MNGMAWYKPGHEITPRDIEEDEWRRGLKAIDTHDLLALKNFWKGELDTLGAVGDLHGKRGAALPQDLDLARRKYQLYKTEIERRKNLL